MGIVERSFGYPGPRGQYSGKFHFIEKHGVQDEVVAMLLYIVLTPRKPTPKSNFRDWTLRELWVLLPPLPHLEPVPG